MNPKKPLNLFAKTTLPKASFVAVALLGGLCVSAACAQATPDKVPVIALVATVGDQVSYSRQRSAVGTRIDPTFRKTVAIPAQTLNAAVLKGLDRAIEREEPGSKRLFLLWNTPADTTEALKASTTMTPLERRSSVSLALIFALRMLGLFLVLPVFALEARKYPGGDDPALVGWPWAFMA
jgi:hypothetical protein